MASTWWDEGHGESGISLLEVLVASVVLIVILIPVAQLIGDNVKQVGGLQAKNQAQALAVATVNDLVSTAENSTLPLSGLNGSSWTPADPANTVVGGRKFFLYEAAGYCIPGTTSSNIYTSGSISSSAPTYFITVKVVWGPQASSSSGASYSVVTDGAVSVAGSVLPSSATCPIGMT